GSVGAGWAQPPGPYAAARPRPAGAWPLWPGPDPRPALGEAIFPLKPCHYPAAVDVERADFVSLPVRDLDGTARFYEETLGLRKSPASRAWPEFELGNVSLYLVEPARMGVESWQPHRAP